MFMGHVYKFFDFSISYTVLNIPLFCTYQFVLFFLKDFIYLLLERLREGERDEEKHQRVKETSQ